MYVLFSVYKKNSFRIKYADSSFGVKYNCPVILLSPISLMQGLTILSNNPLSLATVPHVMTLYSRKMNLWQRVYNVVLTIAIEISER